MYGVCIDEKKINNYFIVIVIFMFIFIILFFVQLPSPNHVVGGCDDHFVNEIFFPSTQGIAQKFVERAPGIEGYFSRI